MTEQTTGSGESTLSSERTDRLLVTVSSLEEANELRLKLLKMKPRPWIFVIKAKGEEKWHILMSNEWGGMPSNEQFDETLEFAKQCMQKSDEDDGFIELQPDEIEIIEEATRPEDIN